MTTPIALHDGRATVASTGTAVPLSEVSQRVSAVTITALPTNTGLVWIGGPTVKSTPGSQRGVPLAAGEVFYVAVTDLSRVYVDAAVNGEGVTYICTDEAIG